LSVVKPPQAVKRRQSLLELRAAIGRDLQSYGPLTFWMLPYVEQTNLYNEAVVGGVYDSGNADHTMPVPTYEAPNPGLAFGSNQPGQQRPVHGAAGYFQVQPSPFLDAGGCKPGVASTGHPSGIMAGMGDGSVRLCARGMDARTAIVPDDGLPLQADW
jgi:hypothetical protein